MDTGKVFRDPLKPLFPVTLAIFRVFSVFRGRSSEYKKVAGHKRQSTNRIYDRSRDVVTIEEIERVQIGQKQEV
jgi:hypothetical protein